MGKQLVIKNADFSANAIDVDPYYENIEFAKAEASNIVFRNFANGLNLFLDFDIQLLSLPANGKFYAMGVDNYPIRATSAKFQLGVVDLMGSDLARHLFRFSKVDNSEATLSCEGQSVTRAGDYPYNFDFIGYGYYNLSFLCRIYAVNQYEDDTFVTKIHEWVPKKLMPAGVIGLYDNITDEFILPTEGTLTE